MSSPSFENIDRWFFEYVEGNLSPKQEEQFHIFLEQHPELEEELEEWESVRTYSSAPTINTAHLLKSSPINNYLVISLTAITLIAFLFWGYSSLYQPSVQYSKKTLELSTLENDSYVKYNFKPTSNNHKTLQTETNHQIAQNNIFPKTGLSNKTSTIIVTNNHSDEKQKNTFSNLTLPLSHLEKQVVSKNLPDIISALEARHEDNPGSISISKNTTTTRSNQQFKRRFTTAMRKAKKMADQPIALSNSRDPHFHIPNKAGFQSNFGMAGTLLRDRFQLTTRNQWVGSENQQLINHVSWDSYIYTLRGGIGIDMTYSDFNGGAINNYEAALTYSPKFSVSKNISIEPALRFKMGTIDLNQNSSIIGRSIEINRRNVLTIFPDGETPIGSQLLYRDLGTGVLINTKWFYAGLNLDNIRRHYNNIHTSNISNKHRAALHFSGIIGTDYTPVGKDGRYSTYLFYQKFEALNELWAGANVQWNFIEIGGGFSSNLDFGSSIGIKLDQFSIHYNLDYLTSQIAEKQILSHQFTMRYLLKPSRYAAKLLNL
jgi:type IX secretion system PorP/SprF family membrane protein